VSFISPMRAARPQMRLAALCTSLILFGCTDQPTVKDAPDMTQGKDLPQFSIVGDPGSVADVPASQRDTEIRKAFEGIFAQLPESQRAAARVEMEKGFVGLPISSHNPEIARLWSRILSLKMAELERPRVRRELQSNVMAQINIKVALIAKLEDSTFRAMVVRRPDDEGIPLLLLPENAANGEDLLRGLQAAGRSISGYRPTAGKSSIIAVRFGSKRKEPSERMRATFTKWEGALSALRQAPKVDLKGYGKARVTMMSNPGRG